MDTEPQPASRGSRTTGRLAEVDLQRARLGIWRLLKRTIQKAWGDRILGLSAETAFWQLLSLPSLFLALLGSLGYFARALGHDALERTKTELLNGFSRALNDDVVRQLVEPTVDKVLSGGRADIVSVGFVLATGLLHIAGIAIGLLNDRRGGVYITRTLGGLIAACGVWYMAQAVG